MDRRLSEMSATYEAASSQQPAASSQQPAASSQQPAASSQQPEIVVRGAALSMRPIGDGVSCVRFLDRPSPTPDADARIAHAKSR
ncbi:hypothetical protein [uncultured Thiocystis sp.]|jgi:hypothetical protein|uniref:hypothetical protein n=1 Tax=uncultured Thiocystis sp. TaxID=1202134 RepID=UPI0025DE6757|nr:hypothetical protein [uncultured Thiocystis sp.]